MFIAPLTAFMNLFFYILQYPTLPTVHSDLDRMYQVCGHFSYLEYMSPMTKFSLPREVTNLARSVVARAKAGASPQQQSLLGCTRPFTAASALRPQDGELVPLEDVCNLSIAQKLALTNSCSTEGSMDRDVKF